MSIVKTKTLIVDILSNDSRDALGGVVLDKNINDCKKLNKTIKTKNKEIEKKTKNNEDVTTIKQDVDKFENDLSSLYSERLLLLINFKDFNQKIIDERFKQYSNKIVEYNKEIADLGEKNYAVYKKQETDKINKTEKNRNIMSQDDYFAKIIGNHEKANVERRLTYELFKLYEKFKKEKDIKSSGLRKDIIEKETLLKIYTIKQNIKQINTRQMGVFITRIKEITQMYTADLKLLLNEEVDGTKLQLQNFNIFIKSKTLKSSKTELYKNMIRFSNFYKLIFDKSKDEKLTEVNVLDMPDDKTVKNFVEKNQTLKFILEKNSINSHFNKEFKDFSIDNKTKNFLTYLIVIHFYNDILPLLNISKQHNITYRKKETIKDEKGNIVSSGYVDSGKNVGVIFNRLNPYVIQNVWNAKLTWT
jgi:hypothetical protein